MRYVNTSPLHQLGLTDEEILFLQPLAAEKHEAFCAAHNFDKKRKFSDQLYSGYRHSSLSALGLNGVIEAEINHSISTWTLPSADFRNPKTEVDDRGFGIAHSSYGAIAVTKPSGNRNDLVGSASVMGYYLDMRFSFCSIHSHDAREPSLFSQNEMFTCSLSGEQFFTLQRTNNQAVPCKLQRMTDSYTDSPPVFYPTLANEKAYKQQLTEICAPLTQCLGKLKEALTAGVSKKAEREQVLQILNEAKRLFDNIRPQIDAMTGGESQKEVMRVERQFQAEMTARMKTLGLEHMIEAMLQLRG